MWIDALAEWIYFIKNLDYGTYNFHLSWELIEAWISSSVFPFVSGTTLATNSTVRAQDPEKTKKVPGKIRYQLNTVFMCKEHLSTDLWASNDFFYQGNSSSLEN